MRVKVVRLPLSGLGLWISLCTLLWLRPLPVQAADDATLMVISKTPLCVQEYIDGKFWAELKPFDTISRAVESGPHSSYDVILFKDGTLTYSGLVNFVVKPKAKFHLYINENKLRPNHNYKRYHGGIGSDQKVHYAIPATTNEPAIDIVPPANATLNDLPSQQELTRAGGAGSATCKTATSGAQPVGVFDVDKAYMDKNRTIFLKLRVPENGRKSLKYIILDPKYPAVFNHVKPLAPGQEKVIQPWHDQ